eukprot:jgi/Mesen1/7395/ME000388S06613
MFQVALRNLSFAAPTLARTAAAVPKEVACDISRHIISRHANPARFASRWLATVPAASSAAAASVSAPFKEPFREKPQSLSLPTEKRINRDFSPPPGYKGLLLRLLGYYSQEAMDIRGARALYGQISDRADDEAFLKGEGLQKLFLQFWASRHNCQSDVNMLISKWMKELEKNFYGAASAYDKAMQPTAASDDLPKALWSVHACYLWVVVNACLGLPAMARYVRREIASLAMTESISDKAPDANDAKEAVAAGGSI